MVPQLTTRDDIALRIQLIDALGTCLSARAVDLASGYVQSLPMKRLSYILVGCIESIGKLPETLTDEAIDTLAKHALEETNMQHLALVVYVAVVCMLLLTLVVVCSSDRCSIAVCCKDGLTDSICLTLHVCHRDLLRSTQRYPPSLTLEVVSAHANQLIESSTDDDIINMLCTCALVYALV